MPLLIDGYNLLYALGRLTPNSRRAALEGARRWLVQQLRVRHPPDTAITVVFDSRSAPMGSRGREDQGNIHVVFSHGESADDVIEGLIQNESAPRALMVVSDDHRLQQAGRRRGCKVLGCLDYYEQDLSTPPSQTTPEPTAKPERSTPEDVERYLKAFGDVDDDPLLRDPY